MLYNGMLQSIAMEFIIFKFSIKSIKVNIRLYLIKIYYCMYYFMIIYLIYITYMLQVRVIDEKGREKVIMQPFSLDGSRLSFGFLPRLILMSNVSRIVSYYITLYY